MSTPEKEKKIDSFLVPQSDYMVEISYSRLEGDWTCGLLYKEEIPDEYDHQEGDTYYYNCQENGITYVVMSFSQAMEYIAEYLDEENNYPHRVEQLIREILKKIS